jgi:DNA/RNA-binding domain of Phe-tRNA-synthetase-like protein
VSQLAFCLVAEKNLLCGTIENVKVTKYDYALFQPLHITRFLNLIVIIVVIVAVVATTAAMLVLIVTSSSSSSLAATQGSTSLSSTRHARAWRRQSKLRPRKFRSRITALRRIPPERGEQLRRGLDR